MVKNNCETNKSKYENWKSVTESDFVTMFIKTWFTFISVLRELNPSISPFDENGRPKGDNPYMKAYRETIMFSVIQKINIEKVKDNFYRLYPLEMKKILQVFPQYFFQTFFRVNDKYHYKNNDIIKEQTTGKIKKRYCVDIKIEKKEYIKGCVGPVKNYV